MPSSHEMVLTYSTISEYVSKYILKTKFYSRRACIHPMKVILTGQQISDQVQANYQNLLFDVVLA